MGDLRPPRESETRTGLRLKDLKDLKMPTSTVLSAVNLTGMTRESRGLSCSHHPVDSGTGAPLCIFDGVMAVRGRVSVRVFCNATVFLLSLLSVTLPKASLASLYVL